MATTISTQDIIDAKRDIDDIGKAVNEKVIVNPRYGEDFKSLPMIAEEFQISSDAAEAAAVSAAESANIAQSSSQVAQDSAALAELAATAATLGGKVYDTPEAGVDPVTGVANGAYYNVRSTEDDSFLVEYQNIGGVPTPSGKSYPSSEYVRAIKEAIIDPVTGKADAEKVFDGDKNQHQINAEIAIKTRYANNIVVTPENFGADTSKADNSNELQDAINFVVANGGYLDGGFKTYKAANLVIDSNTHIRNIYLENNVFDTNLVSVITTETADALRTPLTNVELINVHIDGKRSMLTGMPEGPFPEDGGRHGFRFVRPIDGLVMRGCSANYCAVEGIIIYPVAGIPQAEWQHWVKNVEIDSCEFNWNGRHGGSIDSFDGVVVRNSKFLSNGLDLTVGAPLTSGAAGRKVEGALYGSGWDCEEYHGVAYSKNILFDNCTMLDNASSGLVFVRTGATTVPSSGIRILGGEYDKGVSGVAECSILFGGYSISGPLWWDADITDVDFKGGELEVTNTKINSLTAKNMLRVRATGSDVNSLMRFDVISSSSTIVVPALNEVKPDGVTQQQAIELSGVAGSFASMLFYDKSVGVVRGGIDVQSNSAIDSTMYFSVHGERLWMLLKNGALIPMQDAVTSIGVPTYRVNSIYLATAPVVGSDIKYKKDIENISDVEREVALELKSCIKKYRLIDSDDKHHIGLIAQEVESVFAKHGLNAHDYKLLQYSADSETYALVYEQLILFIISAM